MEQTREARNKLVHLWPIDFQQKCQGGKGYPLQQMVVGQLDVYVQKNGVVFPTANHINKITQNGSTT